jgi:hypothetical protein
VDGGHPGEQQSGRDGRDAAAEGDHRDELDGEQDRAQQDRKVARARGADDQRIGAGDRRVGQRMAEQRGRAPVVGDRDAVLDVGRQAEPGLELVEADQGVGEHYGMQQQGDLPPGRRPQVDEEGQQHHRQQPVDP